MKNNASFVYSFCLVILDFLALLVAYVIAYIIRVKIDDRPLIEFIPARSFFSAFLVLSLFWVVIFALLGLYNNYIYENRFKEFGRLVVGSFVGLLFILSVAYISKEPIFPARLVPFYGFFISLSLLVIFRNLARLIRGWLFNFGIGVNNLLIIGNSKVVEELIQLFGHHSSGYNIIGIVGYSGKTYEFKKFSDLESLTKKIPASNIHSIIQAEQYSSAAKNNQILEFAQQNHISYRFIPGNSELFFGKIGIELFSSSIPVIAVNQTALIGWGRIIKRLFDLALSLLLIILLSPIYALIYLLIFISDFHNPLFAQKRVTRHNRIFIIYKFRTMKQAYSGMSPESAFKKMGKPELGKLYRENGDQLANDPRISWLGHFLRATSLDEIPQLFNVIKGDLSLVGPRALIPEEIKLASNKHQIVSVKSGLTGLAQVSGRKDISFTERRKLDVYYVQNWSFWLDITILIKTLRVIINGRGAS